MTSFRLSRALLALVAVTVTVGAVGTVGAGVGPAEAAGPRPLFQLPVECGEVWELKTYGGHGANEIDMYATSGTTDGRPILASYGGTVVTAGSDTGGGWRVRIDHGDGWQTRYLHMKHEPAVETGETIVRGQLLGFVGQTGASGGISHLHYEQLRDDIKVESYFNGVPSGITDDDRPYSVERTSFNCGPDGWHDFSGDGRSDVLARHAGSSDLYLFRGNGSGSFTSGATVAGQNWSGYNTILRPGDFSGDGKPDVLARHAGNSDLYLFRGNGTGGFTGSATVAGQNWSGYNVIFSPGDFSGDGRPDVLARHAGNNDLYLFRGNGSGSFTSGATVAGQNWSGYDRIFSPGDFTGDGKADVLARHAGNSDLYLFRGNGTGGFTGSATVVGQNWSGYNVIFSAGDFTGDGKADVLARHSGNSDLYLFRGNGTGGFTGSATVAGQNWSGYNVIF